MFQCSSASRKFLNTRRLVYAAPPVHGFSALQRAENSSMSASAGTGVDPSQFQCSSASRKFLNRLRRADQRAQRRFQCSSASRKFLNRRYSLRWRRRRGCFSALQRAENSSMQKSPKSGVFAGTVSVLFSEPKIPQWVFGLPTFSLSASFSALQRAENSSIITRSATTTMTTTAVSVLFSEPKIPQSARDEGCVPGFYPVSVLFSEPKIPQSSHIFKRRNALPTFQCSSASRKFLNLRNRSLRPSSSVFQCSSASRKFLNWRRC